MGFDEKYIDRIFDPFQRLHGRSQYSLLLPRAKAAKMKYRSGTASVSPLLALHLLEP